MLRNNIIFAILLFSLSGLLLPPLSVDAQSDPIMPDWFKTNCIWWQEGLISDLDMINALESLMIQDVIPLDRFVTSSSGFEHQAGSSTDKTLITVGEKKQIPSFQKNVFGYWAEGIVSDEEIVNSIGYLMNEGIINSEKIQKEITERKEKLDYTSGIIALGQPCGFDTSSDYYPKGLSDCTAGTECTGNSCVKVMEESSCVTECNESSRVIEYNEGSYHVLDSKSLGFIFETAKQNELSMTYLQKIKAAEYNLVKNAYDSALSDYSKNKDQTSMNTMINLGNAEKIAKSDSLLATQILKTAVQSVKDAKDMAVKSGLHVLDLEKSMSDKQSEIDSMNRHFTTETEIKSAYKDAQKSQKIADDGLQNSFQSIVADNPEYQPLSSNDKNFVSTTIDGIGYSDFKVRDIVPVAIEHESDNSLVQLSPYGALVVFLIDIISEEDGVHEVKAYLYRDLDEDAELSAYYQYFDPNVRYGDYLIEYDGEYYLQPDDDSDLWNSNDYYSVNIPMPDGTSITIINELPEGALGNVLNSDIIEGHEMINGPGTISTLELPTEDSATSDTDGDSDYLPGLEPDEETTTESSYDDVFIGTNIINSVGDSITTYPDGTIQTLFSNGVSYTLYPDGTAYQLFSDGVSYTTYPDGKYYTLYPDGTIYADNYQDYESGTGQIFVSILINYEYQKWQAQISDTIYYFDTETEMNNAISDLVGIDDDIDGDGISNDLDTKPNEYSDEFYDSESSTSGKIIDRAGHTVKITKVDGSVQIEVGTEGGNEPAIIEILDIETELEPGTTIQTSFG